MSNVKAIDLDDMEFDALPNPIGNTPDESTTNKDLLYSPQHSAGAVSNIGAAHDFDDGTVKRGGGRFNIHANLTRFTQILGGRKLTGGTDTRKIVLAMILGSLLIAGGLYTYLGDEMINGLLGDGMGGEGDVSGSEGESAPAPLANDQTPSPGEGTAEKPESKSGIEVTTPKVEETKPMTETKSAEEIPDNAYWKLPNPSPPLSDATTAISPQQSESWRAALNHPFAYQRFKTVQEMRKAKVEGSVTILYESLAQPKLWTRMEALIGIAEHGVAIDTESMRTAIGDARPDLVRNYFKRFRKDYSEATAHVMRQALRVVDDKARSVILYNLAFHRNEINDQYLYAASQNEKDALPKDVVTNLIAFRPIPAAHIAAYEKSMEVESVMVDVPVKKATEDIKVEKIPANMNVEEVYFINDEPTENEPVREAPPEVKKVDDGFNDLHHSDEVQKAK